MRNVKLFGLAVLVSVMFGGVFRAADKDTEDPKYTIKQVMRMAHRATGKNSPTLSDKVASGKATKDEQAKLLELYTAMGNNKPPKGDVDAWKKKMGAIATAITDLMDGKEGADVDYKAALDCRGCHSAHRGR